MDSQKLLQDGKTAEDFIVRLIFLAVPIFLITTIFTEAFKEWLKRKEVTGKLADLMERGINRKHSAIGVAILTVVGFGYIYVFSKTDDVRVDALFLGTASLFSLIIFLIFRKIAVIRDFFPSKDWLDIFIATLMIIVSALSVLYVFAFVLSKLIF